MTTRKSYPKNTAHDPISLLIIATLLMLSAMLALSWRDMLRADTELEQLSYCQMVALHKQDPSKGWPDFKDSFESSCNADGTVKEH
jgi:hypothetical protein